MATILGEIAAIVSISQFAWNGTKWVIKKHQNQRTIAPSINDSLNFDVDVYKFSESTESIFRKIIVKNIAVRVNLYKIA